MREHPDMMRCRVLRALVAVAACGILTASGGCVRLLPPQPPATRFALEGSAHKLPQLEYRADLGVAVVEAEVTSSSVEPTSIADFGGGSGSWSPAQPTKPGHRWMIVRAYGTNTSWDYPPVDLGSRSATLTCGGRVLEYEAGGGGGGSSAMYRGTSRDGRPTLSTKNIQNAQVNFDGVYQVPGAPATYTLTWDLGRAGTARLSFRF